MGDVTHLFSCQGGGVIRGISRDREALHAHQTKHYTFILLNQGQAA